MGRQFDVLVIGSGPAGMNAAITACSFGLSVLVVDDQPGPGGQIWRSIETMAARKTGQILGSEYLSGARVAQRFRDCGAAYEPETQVWQIEPGWDVYMSRQQKAEMLKVDSIIIASGAQERPNPFPGWTLPGVLTVGAAQILLKSSNEIPAEPVWIAGSGPLPLLYMSQLLAAGGRIAGWLDTTPANGWKHALPHASALVSNWRDVRKGMQWERKLRQSGIKKISHVKGLKAIGQTRLTNVEYTTNTGEIDIVDASLLLVHEGVIPSVHLTKSLGCEHYWNAAQNCFVPVADNWGQTTLPTIFVAGDAMGIGGAKAACTRGEIAAIGVALQLGRVVEATASQYSQPLRIRLAKELSLRPFLDAWYPPRAEIFSPADDTVVCRCEELTAGELRGAVAGKGLVDPNQLKSLTRVGMGPCQGRQCGYTVANILAQVQQKTVAEIGFYQVRPPLKSLTLKELASLSEEGGCP